MTMLSARRSALCVAFAFGLAALAPAAEAAPPTAATGTGALTSLLAPASPQALCSAAIEQAARRHGAPPRLLRALALVESGRTVSGVRTPWPWTINAGGHGRWFDTSAEALAFASSALAAGERSIDLGCLQVNFRWHGEHFGGDLSAMLDPMSNADYAARYLVSLYSETGDWTRAAGYYHSRTPEHFTRYSRLVADAYAVLKRRGDQGPAEPAAPSVGTRVAVAARPPAPALAAPRTGFGAAWPLAALSTAQPPRLPLGNAKEVRSSVARSSVAGATGDRAPNLPPPAPSAAAILAPGAPRPTNAAPTPGGVSLVLLRPPANGAPRSLLRPAKPLF